MGPMYDMETETENEDLEEDHIHPKNTLTKETKNTKTQQHLKIKKTSPYPQTQKNQKTGKTKSPI